MGSFGRIQWALAPSLWIALSACGGNAAPVAVDDAATTTEDTAVSVAVLDNDSDADGDVLSIASVGTAASGTLAIDGDSVVYTPDANFNGSDSFSYTVEDSEGGEATATVSVTVSAVNDSPVGADDAYSVVEDGTLVVDDANGVLMNDSDVDEMDAGSLAVSVVSDVANGTLALADDGSFSYTPDADYFGADSFVYTVSDGELTSAETTVEITVRPVNDAPSFSAGGDESLLEDAGAQTVVGWATGQSAGPSNESSQGLSFAVSNDNNALFAVQPAVSVDGTLTYTPADDANGSATVTVSLVDDGGTDDGGEDTSAAQTFAIDIAAVNDVPSFVAGADPTASEDAGPRAIAGWASAVSAGPANETAQTVAFTVTTDNPALFAVQPAIDASGELTYTAAADANGSANLTISIADDGGTDNGGVDTSAEQNATLTVTAVNDVPSFVAGADQNVDEDEGSILVPGWATVLSSGPANEASQSLSFIVGNDNASLFSSAPAVDPDGNLSFAVAADASGSATVDVAIQDDGGTDDGGTDTSAVQSFTVVVTPINDEPSFVAGADQTVDEDEGAVTVAGWATSISAGADDEQPGSGAPAEQSLAFTVSADNPGIFAAQPAVSATGELSFTTLADANGSATVTVFLRDSGGTDGAGDDQSPDQTFTIAIDPVNDAPVAGDDTGLTVDQDTTTEIDVLANDSDVEGDELTIAAVSDPPNGSAAIVDGKVLYTPDALFVGSDTFTYTVEDPSLASDVGTVTVDVIPDTDPPDFVSSSLTPGDILSEPEAFTSGTALAPATFTFDDLGLDHATATVTVSRNAVPLTEGVDYTVDTGEPGVFGIFLNQPQITPTAITGDTLRFQITGAQDSNGNGGGAEADLSVTFDSVRPVATSLEFSSMPQMRTLLSFSESIDAASTAAFTFEDDGVPVAAEPDDLPYRGSGVASLDASDDFFFFVPETPFASGAEVSWDASGITDVAGNPVEGDATFSTTIADTPSDIGLLFIRWVAAGAGAGAPPIAELTAADLANDAFLIPSAVAGTDADILFVFDRGIASGFAEMRRTSDIFGFQFSGAFDTTTIADDTVRFEPSNDGPGFDWAERDYFLFELFVSDGTGANLDADLFAGVQATTSDGLAPTVVSVAGRRAAAPLPSSTPLLRRGERLLISLSEFVDGRTVAPGNFTLTGPSGVVPVDLVSDSDSGLQTVALAAADSSGERVLFEEGSYSLTIAGVEDLSSPAIAMAPAVVTFEVQATGSPAPNLVYSAPADGDDLLSSINRLLLGFDDDISLASATDLGASRGFRLEQEFGGAAGSVFVPLRGVLVANDDDGVDQSVISLTTVGTSLTPSVGTGVYRFTPLTGLLSTDGVALDAASATPIAFDVGSSGANNRPVLEFVDADLEQFVDGSFTFGGDALGSEARSFAFVQDPDAGDTWTLDWTCTDTGQTESSGPQGSTGIDLRVESPALDTFLAEGVHNTTTLRVTDTVGNDTLAVATVYRYKSATLASPSPTVPTVADLGGGIFRFSGTVTDAIDAGATRDARIFVLVVDTSAVPVDAVGFGLTGTPQLERNADGSLAYSYTIPGDRPLPAIDGAGPLAYVAVVQLRAPQVIGLNSESNAISEASVPFEP